MSGLVRYLATQKVRLLQGLSVLVFYWILVFGTLFVFGAFIVYVVFNRLFMIWPLGILYLTWVYLIDLKTFSRGGRRAEFIRNNPLFDYMRDYFPISLVKTTELDPTRNYIFCYHPHGAIPDGLAIGFGSEALQFSKKFPGVVPYIGVHSCTYAYYNNRIMYISTNTATTIREWDRSDSTSSYPDLTLSYTPSQC